MLLMIGLKKKTYQGQFLTRFFRGLMPYWTSISIHSQMEFKLLPTKEVIRVKKTFVYFIAILLAAVGVLTAFLALLWFI